MGGVTLINQLTFNFLHQKLLPYKEKLQAVHALYSLEDRYLYYVSKYTDSLELWIM